MDLSEASLKMLSRHYLSAAASERGEDQPQKDPEKGFRKLT